MGLGSISACRSTELPSLLEEVDAEFIHRKGRVGGLAERFPRLFAAGNLRHVHVARVEGQVVAAAASQLFTFVDAGRPWRCARIGAVWTHPSFRGRGLASAVMRSLVEVHTSERTQALALWTSIHPFYAALGWRLEDLGLFGTGTSAPTGALTEPHRIADCDVKALDRIRKRHLTRFVERETADWAALPVPATAVEVFVDEDAYALVGTVGDAGYVYELTGAQGGLGPVWASVRARYARVFVNESVGSTADWLAQHGGVTFTPQRLSMWMPLAQEAEQLGVKLFVPYLDRI